MSIINTLDRAARVLSAETVFAPAQTQGEITVIPAATVRGGGGGGAGPTPDSDDIGEGGGFGVMSSPAGAFIIDGQKVRWRFAFNLNRVILGGQAVGIAFFLFSWLTQRSKSRAAVKIARINARSGTA